MPRLHHRVSEIQSEMRDLQAENLLQLRCETREKCSVWLANHEMGLSDVSHRNPCAYDRREEQTVAAGIADGRRGTPPAD